MLYMAKHVFFCFTEEYCVFLDSQKDNYLCASRGEMEELGPWIQGWPYSSTTADANMPARAEASAKQLLNANILTLEARNSRLAIPTAVYPSIEKLDIIKTPDTASLTVGDWVRFAISASRAHSSLKRRHISEIVRSIESRKSLAKTKSPQEDLDLLGSLVAKFNSLRHVFPRSYLCLYDSLALVEFLAYFRVYPDWVFAVQSDPFMAHCWVQQGSTVLNEKTLDEVRAYTPIMKV